MPAALSDRQAKILNFIEGFTARHGYCPTYGEMENATGLARATLHREVKQLEVLRVLRRDEHRVRAIKLVQPPAGHLLTLLAEYDVVGLVQAHHGDEAATRLADSIAALRR